MALACIQDRPVSCGAIAAGVGLRAGRHGRPGRLVVLAAGAAAARVQPEGRVPRAHYARAEETVATEFPQPRQGVRRPDEFAPYEGRGDAPTSAPRGQGPGVPRE